MLKTQSPVFLTALGLFWATLSGCVIHVGSDGVDSGFRGVSSVFGEVSVSQGKTVGDVSSVNGGIELEDDVTAGTVDTVNGSIEIGADVSVKEATTVNGDIEAGRNFSSFGKVKTVNGEIVIAQQSRVQGDVATVNGDIVLKSVNIEGDIYTKNGDISLEENTVVHGDLVYGRQDRSRRNTKPTLTISGDSSVKGDIILKRPVTLYIDDQQLLERIQYRYSDA